jgi:outer membrane protein assembly factor BamB
MKIALTFSTLLSLAAPLALAAADWPEWRGPNRNGVAPQSPALVDRLPAQPVLLWEAKLLAGKANTHASPAITDGRVFVHIASEIETAGADGKKSKDTQRALVAINLADGKELWRHATAGGKSHNTPCVRAGKVLYVDGAGNLICLAADTGKELWRAAFGKRDGTNASPLALQDLVVVPMGKELVAVSLADGSPRWKATIEIFANSPVVWTHQGKPYIIIGNQQILCLDPATGKSLWTLQGTDRSKDPSSPAIHGDLMATMFEGGGLRVHRLSLTGAELVATGEAFRPQGGGAHQATSPVFDGRRIYGVDSEGTFCFDMQSNSIVWRGQKGDTHSSPILVDGKLIVVTKTGALLFDAATGAALGASAMPAAYCSSYAISDGKLVATTGNAVRCYDLRRP